VHEGVYYRKHGHSYVVVRPVRGIRVRVLPAARQLVYVNNSPYFYYYGTFYVQKGEEFEVVDAPAGAVVDALPDGYEVKEKDGTEYYVLEDVLYREVEEADGSIGYEVM
jgi:hypothetical protein